MSAEKSSQRGNRYAEEEGWEMATASEFGIRFQRIRGEGDCQWRQGILLQTVQETFETDLCKCGAEEASSGDKVLSCIQSERHL